MAELCFNLWYYISQQQMIMAIAARASFLGGDEKEKARILAALSDLDYKTVLPHPPPDSLLKRYRGAVHYSAVKEFGIEGMYEEVFRAIQTSLPDGVVIPDEKLFYATTLYNFEYGFVPALIGDGFIRER